MRRINLVVTGVLLTFGNTACGAVQQYERLARALEPTPSATTSPRFNPRQHERIAILVEDHTGTGSGITRQAEDEFMRAAMVKGYTIAERSNVNAMMQELRFQSSGATARDYEQVGNMLNVSAILIVSIDNLSTRREAAPTIQSLVSNEKPGQADFSYATVGGRLISVREAEVLWVGTLTGRQQVTGTADAAALPYVSRIVAAAIPSRL